MNQAAHLPENENRNESDAPHLVARQTGDVEQTVDHGVAVANTGPVAGNITVNVAPETETAVAIDEWWRRWTSSLPAPFLLAGRHDAVSHLHECLKVKPARPIGLYGPSRDEVIAFTAAALLTEHERQPVDVDSVPVAHVVSSAHAWTHAAGPPSILIALFDVSDADLAGAISAGHHVIRPMWPPDDMARATIYLPRITRDEGSDELIMAGWTPRAADRDAALGRRNLRALRRELAADPRVDPPQWMDNRDARELLTRLVLVGMWSDGDHDVVAEVTGVAPDRLARDLQHWAHTDDPPFIRSGAGWRLAAPLDAWARLYPFLSTYDLDRWRQVASRVLGQRDQASSLLRRGIAQGVALLGTTPESPQVLVGARHADHVVRMLLQRSNDSTGMVWQALSDILPLLAEAAPDAFLNAVKRGLADDPPLLATMFTDTDRTDWREESPHGGLLSALETLCWSPDYLRRAIDCLAGLADIDPGGRSAHRPAESLRQVFQPWHPHTSAPTERRHRVLAQLLSSWPDLGWRLLVSLLPHDENVVVGTRLPMFQEWAPAPARPSVTEKRKAIRHIVGLALEKVCTDPARWVELLERVPGFPVDEIDRCLHILDQVPATTFSEADLAMLWSRMTAVINRHRAHTPAPWCLADAQLCRLESIATRLEPITSVERFAHLFDPRPYLPGTNRFDYTNPAYDEALTLARAHAVRESISAGGIDAVLRLADHTEQPDSVGAVTADIATGVDGDVLAHLPVQGAREQFAMGWVARMAQHRGWSWVQDTARSLSSSPDASRSAFYLALPKQPSTWQLVDADKATVQKQYWHAVDTRDIAPQDVLEFADRLLDGNRPWGVLNLLAFWRIQDSHTRPATTLITRTLRAAQHTGPSEQDMFPPADQTIPWLLDCLTEDTATEDILVELECSYFHYLDRPPHGLYARLAREPAVFVHMVCTAYPANNEVDTPGQDSTTMPRMRRFLRYLRHIPGSRADGTIDQDALFNWVAAARELLAAADCPDVGDRCIGELISAGPTDPDDRAWPHKAVRALIETTGSDAFHDGLIAGTHDGIGVIGIYEGGQRERQRATRYRAWADRIVDDWPETGYVLREIARSHQNGVGNLLDQSAQQRADEG